LKHITLQDKNEDKICFHTSKELLKLRRVVIGIFSHAGFHTSKELLKQALLLQFWWGWSVSIPLRNYWNNESPE